MQFSKVKAAFVSWLWAFMLLAGVAALVAGHHWHDELLKAVGQAVTAAGVFAATLKYFQFLDMFKNAIVDVVNSDEVVKPLARRLWSPESLGELSDIEKKWEEITALVNRGRFPELSGKMNRVVKDVYLGKDHNWHYDDFKIHVRVGWLKDPPGFVEMVSTRRFSVVPSRADETVRVSYKFWPPDAPTAGDSVPQLVELIVDGEKVTPGDVAQDAAQADGSTRYTVNRELKGKPRYEIYQRFVRKFALLEDPYLYFATTRPMDGAEVRVQFVSEGLSATFESAGTTEDFRDVGDKDPGFGRDLVRQFDGVIFPNQGFFLIFRVLNRPSRP